MDIDKILKKLWGGDRYGKARTYLKQGRIKNPIIDNNVIIAEVVGSDVYRVKIFLDKDKTKCTCPDYAEYCKHVIAVMLAYKNNKKLFSDNNKIFDNLKNKNKEELINIIKQMHINKIDLMNLFKTKDSKIKQIKDFSKDLYDIEDFFEERYVSYNEVPGLLRKLDSLYTLALDYKEKEDFKTSFAILWSLARTLCYKIGECDDSNGQIGEFFYECIKELPEITNRVITDKKLREKFFNECFKIWKETDFGIEEGMLDLIEESAKKEDADYLINKIDLLLKEKVSKYFEEYRKPDLKDLKKILIDLKNGDSKTKTKKED